MRELACMSWKNDTALMEAARGGDQRALVSLLEAAQPDIRRYARMSCRTADAVDDAVQETLWLLYRRMGALRALNSLSAWLITVVRRQCQRLARKMFHSPGGEAADSLRFSERPMHELRIDLAQAIRSLPEHYREVILLRDIEELTIDEIAAALKLTRESVKARLHRARGLIREYLKD